MGGALELMPDPAHLGRVALRLLVAAIAGGLIGLERERAEKAAGMRTHILVSVGAALWVVAPLERGTPPDDVSRVIQGIVTGIGFLGAGVILQIKERKQVVGLTTAASIWVTAAVGTAVGLGLMWPPLVAVALVLLTLHGLRWLEGRGRAPHPGGAPDP